MSPEAPLLVVDDSKTTRKMITRALVLGGIDRDRILHAENGQEALDLIAERPPCLVLSDVNMPVMDGREFLVQLKERGLSGTIPVVMCTSVGSSRQLVELVRLGAETVIRKPFNPHDLFQKVEPFITTPVVEEPPPAESCVPPAIAGDPLTPLIEETIDHALGSLLSTAAFMAAERVSEAVTAERVLFVADTPFRGPVAGGLALAADADLSGELCLNLTGDPAGKDDTARLDAVAEVLNILAGELLKMLEDQGLSDSETVTFEPPRQAVAAPGELTDASAVYAIDGGAGRLYMWTTLEARAEAPPPLPGELGDMPPTLDDEEGRA